MLVIILTLHCRPIDNDGHLPWVPIHDQRCRTMMSVDIVHRYFDVIFCPPTSKPVCPSVDFVGRQAMSYIWRYPLADVGCQNDVGPRCDIARLPSWHLYWTKTMSVVILVTDNGHLMKWIKSGVNCGVKNGVTV